MKTKHSCLHCGQSTGLLVLHEPKADELTHRSVACSCLPCFKVNYPRTYRQMYLWVVSHPAPKPEEEAR